MVIDKVIRSKHFFNSEETRKTHPNTSFCYSEGPHYVPVYS